METHKTVSSINPSPFFSTLFNHPFIKKLASCLLFFTTAIVDWSVKRKREKEVWDWGKKTDANHVLFGEDSETTDGGWMNLRKMFMWWAWICGTWTDTPEWGCFCVHEFEQFCPEHAIMVTLTQNTHDAFAHVHCSKPHHGPLWDCCTWWVLQEWHSWCLSFKPWNHSTFVEMLQNAHPIITTSHCAITNIHTIMNLERVFVRGKWVWWHMQHKWPPFFHHAKLIITTVCLQCFIIANT